MKQKLFMLLLGLFMVGSMAAQKRVSGTVIDEQGQPVIGASVRVVGNTKVGSNTDLQGRFDFSAPNNAKQITVSYIGKKTAVAGVNINTPIVLKDDEHSLDEAMVVAFGTAKKSSFTGSAQVVTAENIGEVQNSNALNALSGKTTGVQIYNTTGDPSNSSPTIRIRGISSINAGNSPLIILDGMPYSGDMNNINGQDIESMTILKDAAANALYGARGANGVIVITTKKGKVGDSGKITVDAKWGANSRASRLYKTIKNPAAYYEAYYKALYNYAMNGGRNTDDEGNVSYTLSAYRDNPSAANLWANQNLCADNSYGLGINVFDVPEGQLMIGTNGRMNPNATLGKIYNYKGEDYLVTPDDWVDAAYNTSLRQEYNVTATNATEKGSFYGSFGYLNNQGIAPNSGYERITTRLKADNQINKWLKVGGNFSYTHYNVKQMESDGDVGSSAGVFTTATSIAPIYPLYIRDGQGNIRYDAYGNKMYDYLDGANAGLKRASTTNNAIGDAYLNTNAGEGNAATASGFADITFAKYFKFTTNNSVAMDEGRYTYVTNPYYGSYSSSNGIVGKMHARDWSFNFQQLLTYSQNKGKHSWDVMVGHENYRSHYYYLYAQKSNMFDANNTELNGAITDGSAASSYRNYYNTEGWFTRGQYNYDERYFASVSYRRDASSRFAKENRWGNFWSIGGAWVMNKEKWFDVAWIDLLKIKASYGQQGNDNIGNYLYTDTYSIVNASGHVAVVPSTMGNRKITWETNGEWNTGVEFSLWNGRLTGGVEYFNRKTSDMLFSFPIPQSFGYSSYYANIGDMRNQGIEVELNAQIFNIHNFAWDFGVNLTKVANKIVYLPNERKTVTIDGVKGFNYSYYFMGEGKSIYTFRTKKYMGVNDEGESLFMQNVTDGNGNIIGTTTTTQYDDADYYLYKGSALPQVYGGFNTRFEIYDFDLSVDFSYQIGGYVYDYDYSSLMASPTSNSHGYAMHADILKSWSPENPDGSIPRFMYGDEFTNAYSDRFITKASYLSLDRISCGYNLPQKYCKKFFASSLRFYFQAENVAIWTKRQGLDPRQALYNGGYATSSYYSPMRTISGGVTVSF